MVKVGKKITQITVLHTYSLGQLVSAQSNKTSFCYSLEEDD